MNLKEKRNGYHPQNMGCIHFAKSDNFVRFLGYTPTTETGLDSYI